MVTESLQSPRLLKGGLAIYDSQEAGSNPRFIVFQYNPDSLRRALTSRTPPPREGGGGGNVGAAREDLFRVLGPPNETITMTVVLHAADQLADPRSHQEVVELGLHPVLATLELLLYPAVNDVKQNQQQAQQGTVQLAAAQVPLVLLVWGKSRVVPVMVSGFNVMEEHFDEKLNPISAKVELSLKVLTTVELQPDTIGHSAYMSYHQNKENVASRHRSHAGEDDVRGALPAELRGGGA